MVDDLVAISGLTHLLVNEAPSEMAHCKAMLIYLNQDTWKSIPPERPAVGTRVDHPTHGGGTVVELMEDGRTRVDFDNGESHRCPRPYT